MIRKRLTFAALAAVTALGSLLVAAPAEACGRCDRGGYSSRYYDRGYSRSYRRTRYVSYRSYDDGYYRRPRRSRFASYGGYCRTPRYRRSRYVDYVSYRPRRSFVSRYGCGGCGDRFGSRYWLSFHISNTGC